MRKWFVTLVVVGVGSFGAFLLTEKGKKALRRVLARCQETPQRWGEWNENAQMELERIQATLTQIAQSLEPHGEPGR